MQKHYNKTFICCLILTGGSTYLYQLLVKGMRVVGSFLPQDTGSSILRNGMLERNLKKYCGRRNKRRGVNVEGEGRRKGEVEIRSGWGSKEEG